MNVTILVSTIGRKSLIKTIESFKWQQRVPGDRMIVLGDGWERPWVRGLEGDGVEFKRCPKVEFYGHRNIWEAVRACETDYWGWLGDDDLLLPGAFRKVREWFQTGCLLVSEVMKPNGRFLGALRDRSSSAGQIGIAGWQAWTPRRMEIPDFSTTADTDLFDGLLLRYTHRQVRFLHGETTALIRFPTVTKRVWEGASLDALFPWSEEMEKWREPDWNPQG